MSISLREKRILVTGAHGFVGSAVLKELKRREVPDKNIVAPTLSECDLGVFSDCEKITKGIDLIIHLAAVTGGINFHRSEPARILYENSIMNINLVEAARRADVKKIVGIGSAAVYPSSAPLPYQEDSLWTGNVDSTHRAYNTSKKLLFELGLAYRRQYQMNVIHLVPSNMYGPGDTGKTGYVVPTLINRILTAQKNNETKIEVWGTGKPTRDFLFVEDAAAAIILAAEKYDKQDPVNIGSGRETSVRELVETICKILDFRGEIIWRINQPDGSPRRVLDVSRARQEFDFQAHTFLEEGLKKTIEWHIQQ